MNWTAVLAALLIIAAIVLYEIRNAVNQCEMWAQMERDEQERGGT